MSSDPRTIPQSLEAEQGILGCILIAPNEAVDECINSKLTPTAFYDLRHHTIYEQLVEMYDAREPIDIITLHRRLKDKDVLDQVGGLAYLSSLPDCVPSAANLSYYIEIAKEKFVLRETIRVGTEMVTGAYAFSGSDTATLMDGIEASVMAIRGSMLKEGSSTMRELVKKAVQIVEESFSRDGTISGLASGFYDMDKLTDGMHPGDMIVIAARPSVGKTALAMNIATNVAVNLKEPVGVFSLEMTDVSLTLRTLASGSKVNLRGFAAGVTTEGDIRGLTTYSATLAKAPIYIDDQSGLSIMQLRAKARRMRQKYGVKLLVIDYLQLLHSPDADGRQRELTEVSNGIKSLAKELGIPVIVLAQLNRDLEKDKNRKPRLSDLRESGAIEQDADVVGLLYRPRKEGDDDDESDVFQVNLLIAKQRNGATGEVPLVFYKQFTRFESASRVL